MSRSRVTSALFFSLLATVTSCSKDSDVASSSTTETTASVVQTSSSVAAQPAPAASAPPAAAAPASAAPAASVIASGDFSGNPNLRADLLEVRRVSGGALLVKWRVINTSPDKNVTYNFSWNDVYYVDPAENKKYLYLTDSEGNRILDIFEGQLGPGEQRGNWAKFPAPPPGSSKISVTLPKFPPFEDVPVS